MLALAALATWGTVAAVASGSGAVNALVIVLGPLAVVLGLAGLLWLAFAIALQLA